MNELQEVSEVLAGTRRWCVVSGEAMDVLARLPDASVDALITDPPYSSGGFTRGDRAVDAQAKYSKAEVTPQHTFGGDNRDQRGFEYWCVLWLSEALRACREGAPVVQFTDWRQLPITTDALQAGGWVWRGIFVWSKGDACRPQMGRFRAACEYAAWGTKGPGLDSAEVGCLPGVLECPAPMGEDRIHLTQKPEKVMEAVVRICLPGGVVLDPFCGSGTTGIAALRQGRRFIGVERDPKYSALARERLQAEVQGLTLPAARAGQMSLLAKAGGPDAA